MVIEGMRGARVHDLDELGARVAALTADGVPRKEAAARVAEESGASKRQLYEASLRQTAP